LGKKSIPVEKSGIVSEGREVSQLTRGSAALLIFSVSSRRILFDFFHYKVMLNYNESEEHRNKWKRKQRITFVQTTGSANISFYRNGTEQAWGRVSYGFDCRLPGSIECLRCRTGLGSRICLRA